MVHAFTFDGQYYLYDHASGSLSVCDEAAFFVVKQKNGEEVDFSRFSTADLAEAKSEVSRLEQEGTLYAKESTFSMDCKPSTIKALCLHISHNCNFSCAYCFAGGGNYHGESGNMSFAVAKASIDFLIERSGNIHNLEVDFFGGEPLLNFDVVKQTVAYAKTEGEKHNKSFKFTLTTNGMLLSDEVIDYLNEEMDNVVLSIDGRPEVHNRVRKTKNGKDTFDLILNNFLKFRASRKDKSYYVRGTFTAYNLDFAQDVLYLNDLGFDQISVEPVVLPLSSPMAIQVEHLPKIFEQYDILAKEYIVRRRTDKWFNFFHFMIDLDGGPCLKKRLTGCGAGNSYVAVTPSGRVYPCHQFAENQAYELGNVFDKKLDESIRCVFAGSNLLTKPACADCFARYQCSGGCSANSIYQCQDINKPYQVSCEMMRKRVELALAIYATERLGKN